jgi:hypothetical protein
MAPMAPTRLTKRSGRLATAVAGAAALCMCAPPVAAAQIHVDPDGPAGKQYTAPLGQARQQASGAEGSAGTPGSSEQAPAFGQGVQPPGAGGGGDGDGAARTSGEAASGEGGDARTGLILGSALLVLLAGTGGGLALRAGSREPA